MLFTDAYLLYKATHGPEFEYDSHKFFAVLADNLIDVPMGEVEGKYTRGSKKRKFDEFERSHLDVYFAKTSLKKPGTKRCKQGLCRVCKHPSTHVCSRCTEQMKGKQMWLCAGKNRVECWTKHMNENHPESM